MDNLQGYRDEDDEEDEESKPTTTATATITTTEQPIEPSEAIDPSEPTTDEPDADPINPQSNDLQNGNKTETEASEDLSESLKSQENDNDNENDNDDEDPPPKKQKQLSSLTIRLSSDQDQTPLAPTQLQRSRPPGPNRPEFQEIEEEEQQYDTVLITPVTRFPDKTDDTPDMTICLSKVYKAEKVEVSEDRMSAGSTKGYRMVRATRGVVEGAWYFEIKVVNLGESGHTRLGWSTEKGDLQAPVGYDGNSFGYRDIDGSKVHKALREKYGEEGYKEGDVIGFYINLPDGGSYASKPPHLVWYKGQRYACAPDTKEDPPKVVPGSEISFFKNGVCQGVAFKDLYGGRYYPAASMYTLPHQPNCVVKFNFGPEFEFFPEEFGGRSVPQPMVEVPYHAFENRVENGVSDEKKQ
ncbi:hypothetical protein GBA52_014768 [Prunus armeniaca]|nr:hypothetical protein GBA52_014768 [Prunus armeniaca]